MQTPGPRAAAGAAAALFALAAGAAAAAEVKLTPRLALHATYSDNIALAPRGMEKSDWVTRVTPAIAADAAGGRMRLTAGYALEGVAYRNTAGSRANHQLTAAASAEFAENLLFADAQASITQQNISLQAAPGQDNTHSTANRSDVRTLTVSPYLRHVFGAQAAAEIRYAHDALTSSARGGMPNSQADRISMRLDSGAAFHTLGWGVAYRKEKTHYNLVQGTESQVFSGNLRYRLRHDFSLTADAGYEKNSYPTAGGKPEGRFWSAGFQWQPGERTALSVTSGRKFFGRNSALAFSHRTRLTNWSAGYSEEMTTTRAQFFNPAASTDTAAYLDSLLRARIPDPAARALSIESFIVQNGIPRTLLDPLNFFTSQTFLNRRWQLAAGADGVHHTLLVSVFRQTREAQASGVLSSALLGSNDFSSTSNTSQIGGSLVWNWRFAPRSALNLNLGHTRNRFSDSGREDTDKFVKAGWVRKMGPKTAFSLDYRRTMRDSTQAGSDVRENSLGAALNMIF